MSTTKMTPQSGDQAGSTTGASAQPEKDLKAKASEAFEGTVKGTADAALKQGDKAKESVADEISSVSSALRTAADEMRSGSPQERTFGQIAESLADASDALRDKDLGTMVGDLGRFARSNPMVFLGGAALIGFAATRFAKASGESQASAPGEFNTNPGEI
jgi:hypothetical protein